MNLIALRASLAKHEGVRNKPYSDTAGVLTIGIGHNLNNPLSDNVIDMILQEDIDIAISELDRAFEGWREHNDTRQNVLIEMQFNLGASRLKKFVKMWSALAAKDYDRAAFEMMASGWAIQVGKRASTLSAQMKNG